MRVGLDARILAYPKCGISTYVYNLVNNFVDLDQELEVFLFSDSEFHPQNNGILESSRIHKIIFATSKKEKRRWAQKFLPRQLKEQRIDLYHATWNNCVPFIRSCPCVLTIHDLAPWIFRRTFRHIRKEAKYKLKHFLCAHFADLILTDSFKVKEDISKLCLVKKNKIEAVHLGIEQEYKEEINNDAAKSTLTKYGLADKKYLIDSAGISHHRRNSIFALEGFAKFLNKTNSDSEVYLVYSGEVDVDNKEYKYLLKRIKELDLESRVIFTGWVSNQELRALITGALISIIPSLYEGFGLPILEAFACGTAVIATDRGSIPEVAQDAAILVPADDSEALAKEIEGLIEDRALAESLIERGARRLKYFDWKKTASQTLTLYKTLIEGCKQ